MESKQIYTSSTLILGLAKKRKNQSINTKIITEKDKIKVIYLYKEKQLRIRKDTQILMRPILEQILLKD